MVAWDTTLLSAVYPGGPLERHLVECAQAGEAIAVTAPTIMEVVRGLASAAGSKPRFAAGLTWFTGLVSSGLVDVLALDRASAIVAGRVRALHPAPPSGVRRSATKPEQRAGWVLDIQIASCAWTHGHDIATANARDFAMLRDLIARLYPGSSPLAIAPSPAP